MTSDELNKQVPIEVREWLQTVSLSLPTGVDIYVAGGCPLSLETGQEVTGVDVFLTGAEILAEKYKWEITEDEWDNEIKRLKFHHMTFEIEEEYLFTPVDYSICEATRLMLFDDFHVWFYFINDVDVTLADIIMSFDFDICRAWIENLNTLNWEPKLSVVAQSALSTELITVTDNEFLFYPHLVTQKERVRKYKKRFPDFKFVKEL